MKPCDKEKIFKILQHSQEKKNEETKRAYTNAPPALPSRVTLPFPNELFISFIAASNAFFWDDTKIAISEKLITASKAT